MSTSPVGRPHTDSEPAGVGPLHHCAMTVRCVCISRCGKQVLGCDVLMRPALGLRHGTHGVSSSKFAVLHESYWEGEGVEIDRRRGKRSTGRLLIVNIADACITPCLFPCFPTPPRSLLPTATQSPLLDDVAHAEGSPCRTLTSVHLIR